MSSLITIKTYRLCEVAHDVVKLVRDVPTVDIILLFLKRPIGLCMRSGTWVYRAVIG